MPHKSQLGESRIFQHAKLLLLLREKIRAFLQKLKYLAVECWSTNSSSLLQFQKLFVEVMTLRYFVLLSYSLMSLFCSEFRRQELIWQSLHFLIFSRQGNFECFSCQFKNFPYTLIFWRLWNASHSNLVQYVDVTGKF